MTTAPYLVIGTSPFNEYHPKGLLEDWFNNEPEDFGVLPGIDFPATLHRTW